MSGQDGYDPPRVQDLDSNVFALGAHVLMTKFPGKNRIDRWIRRTDEQLDHGLYPWPMAHQLIYEGAWWSLLDAYRWVEGIFE